jgi:hypothetical protein
MIGVYSGKSGAKDKSRNSGIGEHTMSNIPVKNILYHSELINRSRFHFQ